MKVSALRRHPVKSVAGESLDVAEIDDRGMSGDRRWALYFADGKIASGKNSRRFGKVPGLLQWASILMPGASVPTLLDPDGRDYRVDEPQAKAALLGAFGVALSPAVETSVPHFDDAPLHLVTTSSLATLADAGDGTAVDARRTRANVVIDTGADRGWPEDDWLGRELELGDEVVVRVTAPMPRCVMVDMAHRDVTPGADILTTLGRLHGVELGVMASVVQPGVVRSGDPVQLR